MGMLHIKIEVTENYSILYIIAVPEVAEADVPFLRGLSVLT